MKKCLLLFALLALVTSCRMFGFHGSKLARIGPGMTKADVLRKLGTPTSVGGHGNVQIFHYQEDMGGWQWNYYFVRLVDDKVESYGPEEKGRQVTQ